VLHLIKLCVGCESVDELRAWREAHRAPGEPWRLRTRQTPKRAEELLNGGSLYRVYRGLILSRQRLLAIETLGEGPARRCEMVLADEVVLTAPTPRRPFQGWRYLTPEAAPSDLEDGQAGLPPELAHRLRDVGVL
jgi:hypothetical protein